MYNAFAEISIGESSNVSDLQTFANSRDKSFCFKRIRPKSIYGRTSEQIKLLTAYQQVITDQQAKKVIIHGESGSGKTALVNSIQETIIQNGAYFVTGKFFQGCDLQEPHSALASAFSDVCDLVSQSKDLSEQDLIKIKEELKSDSQILKRFITNISPFIYDDSRDNVSDNDIIEYHKDSRISQFKIACKTFLRVMASKMHPIVMFIDDIQWMDDGSRELIHMLLNDESLKHLLIILSYREGEKPEVIGLAERSGICHLIDIFVENLDLSSVHHIVTEVLGTNSSEIRQLSEIVMEKTRGNPFHVMLFLETIQRQKLVVQKDEKYLWNLNFERIEDTVNVSGTLSDLLSRKVALASSETVELLKVASVIGFSFEESLLVAVFQKLNSKNLLSVTSEGKKHPGHSVYDSLFDCVQLGFLWKPSEESYQFTHDNIQSAFQTLNKKAETSNFHANIGEVYFERGYDGLNMYNTAVHWNAALDNMNGRYQRPKLARINLEAAKYCHDKSAFVRACMLLRAALALFESHELWESRHFELTFEIVEMLAKMELIIGNFSACKEITENVISQNISIEKKVNFLVLGIEVRITAFESVEAGEATTNALHILGLSVPRKISLFHVAWSLCQMKLMLLNKTEHETLNLPMMRDKKMAAAVRILVLMCSCYIRMNKLPSAIFLALQAIRLTVLHGLSPYSAYALAMYGVAEVVLRNYDKGYRLGQLAVRLSRILENKDALCGTMSFTLTFLSFWKDSLHIIERQLLHSGTEGFEVGDLMYGEIKLH
jgi:predicted ATPase